MVKRLFWCGLAVILVSSARASTTRFKGYTFEAYAVSDIGYRYCEIRRNDGTYLQVDKDEEYSLVINNPLPVRVAVAVTIDGLNVIDGRRTTPAKAEKWLIGPYSSFTLRGWQTDRSSLRRFVFTDKSESYAKWKGGRDNKPYIRNLGVIGVAYFWNSAELKAALRPPKPFARGFNSRCERKKSLSAPKSQSSELCDIDKSQAGTGMGKRETNNVVDVAFRYDTGMYRTSDILTIYYEFARSTPRPLPYIDRSDRRGFAPEMP